MAKKQVAVSLRKPPSPETIDAFVQGGSEGHAVAAPKRARRGPSKLERTATAETTPAPPSVTPVPESAVVSVAARKESTPPDIAPPDIATPDIATPDISVSTAPATVKGPNGATLRAVTIYLPPELSERLTMHCIERDRDASNVIGEALENHLAPRLGAGSNRDASEVSDARTQAEPSRPSGFWPGAPFSSIPHVEWPPRRIVQIVELGRILLGIVRRRAYAV